MSTTRIRAVLLFGVITVAAVNRSSAQENPAPSTPGKIAPLTWKRVIHLHDGRTFVSDGALALDIALVKAATPPSQDIGEAGAKVIEGYLRAELPDEFAFSQLTRRGDVYAAPTGVTLNPVYVDYLRRTLPESGIRFRMKSQLEPVVILLDGRAVGLLMAMKSAK